MRTPDSGQPLEGQVCWEPGLGAEGEFLPGRQHNLLFSRSFRAREWAELFPADRQLARPLTVQVAGQRLQIVVRRRRLITADGDLQIDLQGCGVAVVDDEGGAVGEQVLAGRCQAAVLLPAMVQVATMDPAVALAGIWKSPARIDSDSVPSLPCCTGVAPSRSGMSVQGFGNEARSSGCLAWAFFSASSARRSCSSRSAACPGRALPVAS